MTSRLGRRKKPKNARGKRLTLRDVPARVAEGLSREAERRGVSQNQMAIELLQKSLGLAGDYDNGLGRFAGTWTLAEFDAFNEAVAPLRSIDRELWQ
jgi:hypothetical protein